MNKFSNGRIVSGTIKVTQNFLRSYDTAEDVVRMSGVGSDDLVVEIGTGSGKLTRALARKVAEVITIEKDANLARSAQEKFADMPNVHVLARDFLTWELPEAPFKVVANIPFNVTAEIMYKLLQPGSQMVEGYLFMQKEAAERFTGHRGENKVSLQIKPLYELEIIHNFSRQDFVPAPEVNVVLLAIYKRDIPFVQPAEYAAYRKFIAEVFDQGKQTVGKALKKVNQPKLFKLSKDHHFKMNSFLGELSVETWIALFRTFGGKPVR